MALGSASRWRDEAALSLCEAWDNLGLYPKERVDSEMFVQGWLRGCGNAGLVAILFLAVIQSVTAQVLGDVDCDGEVNRNDLLLAERLLFDAQGSGCSWSDLNFDGRASSADLTALITLAVAPSPLGPVVTYFGLAAADGTPLNSSGTLAGAVLYHRPAGQGFKLVIEARPGSSGVSVGQVVFASDPRDPTVRPDLWVVVSRPLGDGSPTVCEGGVPAIHPPNFRPLRPISDAINDLSCHFAVATAPAFACTSDRFGRTAFVTDTTQVQFCLQVTRQLIFADGETLITAVVRDRAGNLGSPVQMRLRVGPGPFGPSPTPTGTATATALRVSPSSTRTFTPTVTRSPLPSLTWTPRATTTATNTPRATSSPTFTPSAIIPSQTPTRSAAAFSPSPTSTVNDRSPTSSPSSTPVGTSPAVLTSTPTATVTVTPTPTATRTPTRSPTAKATPTATRSASPTPSRTRTPTRSPTAPPGPVIRYFGLTRSDDTVLEPSGTTAQGVPIFTRPQGFGFNIVIEAARGPSGNQVGSDTFVPSLTALPDLQIVASRPLGDGSDAVCDSTGPTAGGVPALDPPSYLPTEANIRVMNDFGCRFVDGAGNPRGRGTQEACTRVPPELDFRFVAADTSIQFCAPITRVLEFPPGDTVLTARVLDQTAADAPPGSGVPGPTAQIVVRVVATGSPTVTPSPSLTPTATRSPSPSRTATGSVAPTSPAPTISPTGARPSPTRTSSRTPTAVRTPSPTPSATVPSSGPVVNFFGIARADGSLLDPVEFTAQGIPVFSRNLGAGFFLVIEAKPGPLGTAVGLSTFQPDLVSLPDLQIVASQTLGNGSEDVCDYQAPTAGGVPAIDPPRFDNIAVVNDFSCRFRDGANEPRGRASADACVLFPTGGFGFVRMDSTVQFCAFVDRAWEFPAGDTLLSARVRDTNGNTSTVAQIVVRVSG